MKKRKAQRVERYKDERPASYVFVTIKNGKVYVLIYRYVWQIIHCPSVIDAAGQVRKYIKEGDGERVNVYAVSEKALALGRIKRLMLQQASNAHHKNAVNALTHIYNWLNGHSLECLTYSKLPINIYYALDYHIKELGIEK